MKNYALLCLFLLLGFVSVGAQTNSLRKADKYYEKYSFDKAIKRFTDVDTLKVDEMRKLALSYKNLNEYADAAAVYARFVDTNSATAEDCYNYVLMLKAQALYDEANVWMENMTLRFSADLRVRSFQENKTNLASLLLDTPAYKLVNLKINSEHDDFGTCYFKSQVLYASNSKNKGFVQRKYNWTDRPFFDMVVADLDSVELLQPRLFNKSMNQKWHEGPASFAKEGAYIAFTRNNYEAKSADDVVKLQIFFSQYIDSSWTKPEAFYLNNAEYSVGHPSLTADGNTLFFTSDMLGGLGGTDIYCVKKDASGKWGKAINLGDKINTEGNEMFPFYEENNDLLFFASNANFGLGGLDIFMATQTGDEFENAQNLGSPINTRWDDFALIYDKDLHNGFLSSNRNGGKGGDDIYRFSYAGKYTKSEPVKPLVIAKSDSVKTYTYRLAVLNAETGNPIPKALVKMGQFTTETNQEGLAISQFAANSLFSAQVSAMGYEDNIHAVEIKHPQDSTIINDTVSMKIKKNQAIVLRNIYYDYDKWDILPESAKELNKLIDFMKQNPQLKVELSSHTDSRGSDDYNRELSRKRALSAIYYILDNGISSLQLSAKGYGETRPVNKCVNGVKCSEQEHRQNRRTEILIEDFGKAQNIIQTKGKE